MLAAPRAGVFLDRDGTIIQDRNYLGDPDGVSFLPGAVEGIARLNAAGWPVIVVTNQSGIGRGLFTEEQYRSVEDRVQRDLSAAGARLAGSYHCPHDPERPPACACRKPLPGLFLRAASDHNIDLEASHYIGDRMRDIEAGLRLGGTGYLLRSGEPPPPGWASDRLTIVDGIQEAADLIIGSRAG